MSANKYLLSAFLNKQWQLLSPGEKVEKAPWSIYLLDCSQSWNGQFIVFIWVLLNEASKTVFTFPDINISTYSLN